MLHTSAVEPGTLAALKKLMQIPSLSQFALVGGTALALYKGHRLSVDIDLFSPTEPFNYDLLISELKKAGKPEIKDNLDYALFMEFDGVKVDVVKYPYPWINPVVREQDIRLASEQDICAMKLAAITKRGLKKDFIDIYFLLKEYSLQRLFEFFHRKYPESETYMTVKSLTYFTDADQSEMPVLLKDKSTTWEQVKETLHQAVKSVI